MLHRSLVVIDEQAGWREIRALLALGAIELNGAGDRIRRAAADRTLIIGRPRNLRTQIHRWRQRLEMLQRRGVSKITMVRQVGNQSEAKARLCRGGHFILPGVVEL